MQSLTAEQQRLKAQLNELQEAHLTNLKSISTQLQDFIGGREEISDTIEGQNSVIDCQLVALRKVIRVILENDTQNKSTIRKAEEELRGWTEGISSVIGPSDCLMVNAIEILADRQNPLKSQIRELSAELRRRDQAIQMIWTRVSGIWTNPPEAIEEVQTEDEPSGHEIRKPNLPHQILQSLGAIHDEAEKRQKANIKLEESLAILHDSLRSIESRLRGPENEELPPELTDEILIERIHRFVDAIVSPSFSEQFMSLTEINSLFDCITAQTTEHPKVYIKAFCQHYLEMEKGINATRSFLPVLDRFLQILTPKPCNPDFTFLQKNADDLHDVMRSLTSDPSAFAIFGLASRFVSLIQILIAHIGSLTGHTLRIR
jgi:hypothetical protein